MPATFIETRELPITGLTPYPGNARRADVQAIRDSVRAHGQYRAIVVRRHDNGTHTVLAGNHTADALAAEGHGTARCEVITCTDEEARRINLADNRIPELAGYDDTLLAGILAAVDDGYDGTGWDDETVTELLRTSGHLGNEASAFLEDYASPPGGGDQPAVTSAPAQPLGAASGNSDDDDDGDDPPGAQEPDGTETVYVQVTWLVPPADRRTIHDALDTARQRWNLPTNAAALTRLCADWLTNCA